MLGCCKIDHTEPGGGSGPGVKLGLHRLSEVAGRWESTGEGKPSLLEFANDRAKISCAGLREVVEDGVLRLPFVSLSCLNLVVLASISNMVCAFIMKLMNV